MLDDGMPRLPSLDQLLGMQGLNEQSPTIKPLVRFSTLYVKHEKPVEDNPRARKRLQKYYQDIASKIGDVHQRAIESRIEQICGIDIPMIFSNPPQIIYMGRNYKALFCEVDIITFMNMLTVIYNEMPNHFIYHDRVGCKDAWLQICRMVFVEENLGYEIDDYGVVHFKVDEEFVRNKVSAIASLAWKELGAVRLEADQAFASVHRVPPDTKAACRHMVEAVEILFKIIAPDVSRLGSSELRSSLLPLLKRMYAGNRPAADAATNVVAEIGAWVNWLHIYRHGQRVEEPSPPPLEIAVLGVSAGATYLRFLADVRAWQVGAEV
jgi:hypothetical protein